MSDETQEKTIIELKEEADKILLLYKDIQEVIKNKGFHIVVTPDFTTYVYRSIVEEYGTRPAQPGAQPGAQSHQ